MQYYLRPRNRTKGTVTQRDEGVSCGARVKITLENKRVGARESSSRGSIAHNFNKAQNHTQLITHLFKPSLDDLTIRCFGYCKLTSESIEYHPAINKLSSPSSSLPRCLQSKPTQLITSFQHGGRRTKEIKPPRASPSER